MWPNNRVLDLLGVELPIIQAPMAGAVLSDMVVAVSEAGGLGSLPCALLSFEQVRGELEVIRRKTSRPINVNFFCHQQPPDDPARDMRWRRRLDGYYIGLGLDNNTAAPSSNRAPFDDKMCDLVAEFHPEVVSFHFGLPEKNLLARVRRTGAKIISSATTIDEARWLEDQGCDAIIAQGYEAGGHSGMFLKRDVSTQIGTMALVPQVVDAVRVPVIAAGGIADARGIVAAFALGASAVQIGTAYLLCPEAKITAIHRQALRKSKDNGTVVTNVFTGRPARAIVNRLIREVGPMADDAPEFPLAAGALLPLRLKAETVGSSDFTPLWSGQAARLSQELPAARLTKLLAEETLEKLRFLAGRQDTPIGHVGLRAANLAASAEFYRDIFGMEITGGSPPDHPLGATAFLSSRPDQSHEIALFANPVFAHIAFKVSSLAELRSFHARVVEKKIPIKFVLNHHESFAFYFDDPDGNMIEVYWPTEDLSWRQPYAEPLDLSQSDETLLEKITATP